MTCALSQETLQQVIAFHGHSCPGLTLGIRAAEMALRELGPRASDEEIVAVTETDMCGVDAVQFLTGCTFGKGNLLYRDRGKVAFSFYRRSDGKSFRLVAKPFRMDGDDGSRQDMLRRKAAAQELTPEETEELRRIRQKRIDALLAAPLEALFDIKPVEESLPPKARLFRSVPCSCCGETFMEPRGRLFEGETLCLSCFEKRTGRKD
ncbi:FmdE family protein [Aminiphilus circumscriptus]|jgi:formylmethanofuran dehydrogenase subunit E|uniref:FmdE family protein n=1 Tax=Aminiphilus circumscriptus TaxID=290732 RepID=UPI00047864D6|nr:FmdE family protein [Aminiphilus circumscriptus]